MYSNKLSATISLVYLIRPDSQDGYIWLHRCKYGLWSLYVLNAASVEQHRCRN